MNKDTEILKQLISKGLKNYLKKSGKSIYQLAKEFDVSYPTMFNAVHGKSIPNPKTKFGAWIFENWNIK